LYDIETAREAAARASKKYPGHHGVNSFATMLADGELPPLLSRHYQDHPPIPNLDGQGSAEENAILRLDEFARARALGDRLSAGADEAAIAEVTALLAEEPDFAYAQLLAVRAGIMAGEEAELASVPAAFERALGDEDAQMLARLAERTPKLEALTLVARALFGDVDSQDRIAGWLAEAATDEPDPIAAMRPRLRLILGGATDADTVAAGLSARRDTVLTVLRRVNEALIDSDLIAA
jgi:hypothetical protein